MMIQPNFNDSFNARYLDYEQVADTFIPNHQYYDLLKNNHSLLMGPRGSGKTTLLKMLTAPGQHYLRRNKKSYDDLPFTSIYIPSDIQWKKQMEHFYNQEGLSKNKKEIISRFLVTTNVLMCLTSTFKHLIELDLNCQKYDVNTGLRKEAELCMLLIDDFEIDEKISPSLLALEKSLLRRISRCNKLINKLKFSFVKENEIDDIPEYYFNDYYRILSEACSSYESIFNGGKAKKWALCFDELEISPQWLQFELIEKLRSVDQRFFFKLVTSPIISLVDKVDSDNLDAAEGEDYKIIRTWNFNETCLSQWNIFSKKLTENRLKKIDLDITSEDLFGESIYERNLKLSFPATQDIGHKTKYDKGSLYWKVFRELAIIDGSFKAFLTRKEISISNPIPKSTEDKDRIFRKILPIVVFRYQFNKSQGRRSRKNPALFYGVPFIYELCDGNPRFLMNLLDSLVNAARSKKKVKLDISVQSSVIKQLSQKYIELIRAHPDANRQIFLGHTMNLGDLIYKIGSYFREKLLHGEFIMDPNGSFIVDSRLHSNVISLIELGVHLGAIIYLDPTEGISKSGLIGKKFRLCYLLHPIFDLPKREYSSVALSRILYKGSTKEFDPQLLMSL